MGENEQAERLLKILERNREAQAPEVPPALLAEVAELQQQNQFDDARKKTQKAIRELVEEYAKQAALKEVQEK